MLYKNTGNDLILTSADGSSQTIAKDSIVDLTDEFTANPIIKGLIDDKTLIEPTAKKMTAFEQSQKPPDSEAVSAPTTVSKTSTEPSTIEPG